MLREAAGLPESAANKKNITVRSPANAERSPAAKGRFRLRAWRRSASMSSRSLMM